MQQKFQAVFKHKKRIGRIKSSQNVPHCVSSFCVTYYSHLEEVGHHLKEAGHGFGNVLFSLFQQCLLTLLSKENFEYINKNKWMVSPVIFLDEQIRISYKTLNLERLKKA